MNTFEKACSDNEKEYTGENVQENAIEFLKNSKTAVATFCQGKFINKIKKLADKYPKEFEIIHENNDGSIVVRFPVSCIHIYKHPNRPLTEEQKKILTQRIQAARKKRKKSK